MKPKKSKENFWKEQQPSSNTKNIIAPVQKSWQPKVFVTKEPYSAL